MSVLKVAVEVSSVIACFCFFLRCGVLHSVLALPDRVVSHGSWWSGEAGRLANTVARCILGNGTAVETHSGRHVCC